MKTAVMRVWWAMLVVLVVLVVAAPALAHHSFAGEYDGKKPVTITGTVTKVEWTNPHARFYVDAKEADGTVTPWAFELGSPNLLIRYGFTKDLLTIGSVVTVEGYQALDGTKVANGKSVKFPDGKVLAAGSAAALVNTK
jgi:DNA/RNA endonuclease YhcR with UshA esterase domain